MKFKTICLIIILGLILFDCKKSHDNKEGSLLKRITNTSFIPPPIDTFIYNSSKILTSIKHFNNSGFDYSIEYDSQGKLNKAIYSYQGVEQYRCTFVYNSAGQIVKKACIPSQGYNYAYDESYTYDNSGRLLSDTTYYQQTNIVEYYFYGLNYDSKGNIIVDNFKDLVNTGNQGQTLYEYDNNLNPYNVQGSIYFYVTGNFSYLNKNNTKKATPWWTGPIISQIEYQSNGLPKKIITSYPFVPYTESLWFEYY